MNILVRPETHYGKQYYYPENDLACLIAYTAGTKTIAKDTLARFKAMGFSVELVPVEDDLFNP